MQKKVIILGGPTASGKTSTAITWAHKWNCSIISADSRQIYKEMSIGTAKPTQEELAQAPHYLIDHVSVTEEYSVGDFERDAIDIIKTLHQKEDTVIIVGGTGLYHKAIAEGLDTFPDVETSVVEDLKVQLEHEGLGSLQKELLKTDPSYAQKVDLSNPHRIIRALSVIRQSGHPFSMFLNQKKPARPFTTEYYTLTWDRRILYDRINLRVDIMIEQGLLKEVETLLPFRHLHALNTVGYKEIFEHIDGHCSLEHAIEKIKQHSRNYAKRQMTWFRNQGDYNVVVCK